MACQKLEQLSESLPYHCSGLFFVEPVILSEGEENLGAGLIFEDFLDEVSLKGRHSVTFVNERSNHLLAFSLMSEFLAGGTLRRLLPISMFLNHICVLLDELVDEIVTYVLLGLLFSS
jgi:hypothetical protein